MTRNKRESISGRKNKQRFGAGILIILAALALIYLIFASVLVTPRANLVEGEIATETIKAPREVEDTYSTSIAKQNARNAVGPSFSRDEQVTEQVIAGLNEAMTAIDIVRALGLEEYNRMRDSGEEIKFTVEFYEECLQELPEGFITLDAINILQINEEEEYIRLKEEIITLVEKKLQQGVTESALIDIKNDLKTQLLLSGFDDEIKDLADTLVDIYLRANLIYNSTKTEEAKDEAESLVEPIIYSEGDIIVNEGDEISKAQLEVLKTLGLAEDKNDSWIEYTAIGILVVSLFILIIIYMVTFNKDIAYTNKMLSLTLVIVVVTLGIIRVLRFDGINVDVYFLPTSFAPIMLYLMLGDKRLAIYINALVSVLVGFISIRVGEGILLPIVTASFVAGTISVFAMRNASQRSAIFYAGVISGVAMGLVYIAFDLMNRLDIRVIGANFLYGLISGALVAILTVGILPLFEAIYKVVTPMKLMEISNPNQPLLKKLLLEAPGTYHHSIMVGNMAERAADAVGANALLVRTAAYYHDVGKTKRPYFFVENHADSRNPHDNIDSKASVDVITSHLSDGMDMLRRANIPPIVQEIASQHHGDTAVMYFYRKDKEESNYPENIKMENYRYKGERPKTKEAGILMLADSCEAAVRSLEDATRDMVKERIDSVVKGKLDDGQLDYCDLTLKEISAIKDAFLVAQTGLFHERIEYPEAQETEEE